MSEFKLTIPAGSTFVKDFSYRDDNDRCNDLTGYGARMQMRRQYADQSPAYSFTMGDGLSIVEDTDAVTFAGGMVVLRSHTLVAGEPIKFATTGALPTGLTPGTTYYVIDASMTPDSFKVSATPGGSPVVFTETGNGYNTLSTVAKSVVRLSIPAPVTATMFSIYVYDIELVAGNGDVISFVYGSIQIRPEATK